MHIVAIVAIVLTTTLAENVPMCQRLQPRGSQQVISAAVEIRVDKAHRYRRTPMQMRFTEHTHTYANAVV